MLNRQVIRSDRIVTMGFLMATNVGIKQKMDK